VVNRNRSPSRFVCRTQREVIDRAAWLAPSTLSDHRQREAVLIPVPANLWKR